MHPYFQKLPVEAALVPEAWAIVQWPGAGDRWKVEILKWEMRGQGPECGFW